MNAQKSLSRISADKALWIAQWKQESFERDIRSGLHAAEEIGMAKGLAKGAHNAKIEAARNLLAMQLGTIEQIAQASGLSVEEVQSLAREMGN
jgi:predicted transposase/invertase (TIGR01784 family)